MTELSALKVFRKSFETLSLMTGEDFFRSLVECIARILMVDAVWVTEFHKSQNSMTTVAYWHSGGLQNNFTYLIDKTPCEMVINSNTVVHFAEKLAELFPSDHQMSMKYRHDSYIGASLVDEHGDVIGSLTILNGKPMSLTEDVSTIIRTIKYRAESEMKRLRRERELIDRENQLRGLVNGVRDLLINLNDKGEVVMLNSVAESTLGLDSAPGTRRHISGFLTDASKSKLLSLIEKVSDKHSDEGFIWIPGMLQFLPLSGDAFEADGTLSRYTLDEVPYYTLVLRNKDDRAEAGERIKQLIDQTEHLREELEDLKLSKQLIGESNSIRRLLQKIYMVAYTDATVLITGETGTGKELVARLIHQTSARKDKPMITVNCGAIPASLIESEFFGHTKGAFTGALGERKGRFLLADSGTIFLDEIGELPLDLQVKLLRVIQENEFEPVGSSRTIKVNVRIIAATHRNLFQLCKEGKFREDLYYRLNVFPIDVPPLRERQNDVVLIANMFIRNFSKRLRKKLDPLTEQQESQLRSYSWPGNVRELQNIIERSAIMARTGSLDLESTLGSVARKPSLEVVGDDNRILTRDEFLEFEKLNIIRALKAARWKVSGKDGAAALLHMVPSTLSSRISALGIKMPRE